MIRIISKIAGLNRRLWGCYLLILISQSIFFIRLVFFGWPNALNYLKRVDKCAIIPILKLYGAKVGQNCDIESGLNFHNARGFHHLSIGDHCHIGKDCFFDLRGHITLQNYVVISMRTTIITYIDMSQSSLSYQYPNKHAAVLIKNDAYIGAGTMILMGVTIGSQCLVAAGSLVNKNCQDNSTVAGVPVKRF